MTLPDKGSYQVRSDPFGPLPGTDMCEHLGGRVWLDSLSPRAKGSPKSSSSPLPRARAYARTAPVTHLVIEAGTIRCWINENTNPAPSPYAYTPQPNPTVRIPVLDWSQWRDLTLITRHLAARWPHRPAEDVLYEIINAGARNGIRLLPTIDQCQASCSCSSRSALCQHAATALYQTARLLDHMPLALLLIRGRSATDFFAGILDPDHPSLLPHYRPGRHTHPPDTSADAAYDRWQHSPRPPLPPLPLPSQDLARPVLPGMPGTDTQAVSVLATETSWRAHAMLRALTTPEGSVPAQETEVPADAAHDAVRLAARHHLRIPLQRRLQETLGMSADELARAVTAWRPTGD
ncbi:SWIM zinc finger family protein [Streptomyces sp. NPDC047072]|uniref:SWIM zinc finger family protein n=1 Tax=Streptomyces sp. NPDC047072 TaxID=3154809 RepID=UPI0033D61A9F